VYIGVFAYGEQRFELTFNPCNANIYRLVLKVDSSCGALMLIYLASVQ
jgi:hypothetical protein